MKDPAFLFYSKDFRTGTIHFTDDQTGKYIRLLCDQHQIGHLPEYYMTQICGNLDSPVIAKFVKDANGYYYNERLEEETKKRINWCESRRNNVNKRYNKSTYVDTYVSTSDLHMGNANANGDVSKDVNENIKSKKVKKLSDEEFISNIKENIAYKHIDIEFELNRMDLWLMGHPNRKKTRRFIVNWLSRIEKPLPMQVKKVETPTRTHSNFKQEPLKDPVSKERLKEILQKVTKSS